MKGQTAYNSSLKNKPIYDFLPEKDRTDASKSEKFNPEDPKHRKIYENYLKRQHSPENYEKGEQLTFPALDSLAQKFGPSFNMNTLLEPRDLAEMYIAAHSSELSSEVDQALLREKFSESIASGADKYATQLIFIRMLKDLPFIEPVNGKFSINEEKFNRLPLAEQQSKRALTKILANGSRNCEDITSVYDAAFKSAESLAVSEKSAKKETNAQANQMQEERLTRKFNEATDDLDPEMLKRVAESKRELEIESQKLTADFSREQEIAGETFEPDNMDADMLACDYIQKHLEELKKKQLQQGVEATQE